MLEEVGDEALNQHAETSSSTMSVPVVDVKTFFQTRISKDYVVEALIKEIERRPSIWDQNSEDYKHCLKNAEWYGVAQTLSHCFGFNGADSETMTEVVSILKNKWRSIKTYYYRTIKINKDWKYSSLLKFMKPAMRGLSTKIPSDDVSIGQVSNHPSAENSLTSTDFSPSGQFSSSNDSFAEQASSSKDFTPYAQASTSDYLPVEQTPTSIPFLSYGQIAASNYLTSDRDLSSTYFMMPSEQVSALNNPPQIHASTHISPCDAVSTLNVPSAKQAKHSKCEHRCFSAAMFRPHGPVSISHAPPAKQASSSVDCTTLGQVSTLNCSSNEQLTSNVTPVQLSPCGDVSISSQESSTSYELQSSSSSALSQIQNPNVVKPNEESETELDYDEVQKRIDSAAEVTKTMLQQYKDLELDLSSVSSYSDWYFFTSLLGNFSKVPKENLLQVKIDIMEAIERGQKKLPQKRKKCEQKKIFIMKPST